MTALGSTFPALRDLFIGKAQRLVAQSGFTAPPIDPHRLAQLRGIRRIVLSTSMPVSGQLVRDDDGLLIKLNATEPQGRRNFTCCHEVAHTFALDSSIAKFRVTTAFPDCSHGSLEEQLCDAAAAEMLMPERLFRPMAVRQAPALEAVTDLARKFSSSIRATILRIGQLAVWPVIFIGWRFTTRPGSSPKLRVSWSVRPRGVRCFIPLHVPADRASGMYATFSTGVATCESEFLNLGSLRGTYLVENARFGNHVVSVVHHRGLEGRMKDAR